MRRKWLSPGLFTLFLFAIGVAWIVANPPGGGPDETGHYLKAVAAARGDFHGHAPRKTAADQAEALSTLGKGGQMATEVERFLKSSDSPATRWALRTSSEYTIPAGLGNPAFGCGLGQPKVSAGCLHEGHETTREKGFVSLFGTYQPFLHLGPGLATLASHHAASALRLGRTVNALCSFGLIALAALALWDRSRGWLSLSGFVVAFTPAIVSFSTALTPSGPEIAGGFCLAASLIRLTRDEPAPRWVWVAAAVGGAVLGGARSLGPLFVAAVVVTILALSGPGRVRAAWSAVPRWVIGAAAAVVVAGTAAGTWWELTYQPRAPFTVGDFFSGIGPSIRSLWNLAKEGVGVFSALDTVMPQPAYLAWAAMFAVLFAAAFMVSGRRDRVGLVALGLGVGALTVVASAVYRQTGFELQARHVLPVAVLLPLWAGELVHRNPAGLQPEQRRALLAGLTVVAAAVQAIAFYTYCRRFAVGTEGPWFFVPHADWSPPLGWMIWLVVAGVGTLAYAAAGWFASTVAAEERRPQAPAAIGHDLS